MEQIISIDGLCKSFGDVKAVQNLSFQVKKRRTVCISRRQRRRKINDDIDSLRTACKRCGNGVRLRRRCGERHGKNMPKTRRCVPELRT